MKISARIATWEEYKDDCLIVGVYDSGKLTPTAEKLDTVGKGFITKLLKQKTFQGKLGQILPLFDYANRIQLVLLIGCGKEEAMTPIIYRKIVVGAINAFKSYYLAQAVCYLSELNLPAYSLAWKTRQITEATYEAFYRFDIFKSEKEPETNAKSLIVAIPKANEREENVFVQHAIREGQAIAAGVMFAKNMANTPSNICTPEFMAEAAKELGADYKNVKVTIHDEDELRKLGMGALLGVAQGSSQDAKLICIEYQGHHKVTKKNKSDKSARPVALVGKGITFDTGGNSLKPADSMVGMKYDMCGGASVIGTIKALCELELPIHVVGIVPAAENMPGGSAYKPEDILTSLSGQTIEVMNTDAEGRLILADALTYCERYHPEVIIDIATLTGAAVIALGFHASALFSNNENLNDELLKASVQSNDRVWPMPLWEEYQEQLKSPFADVANVGGRPAGAITAACFLSRFTKKFAWAHLDVAGTAAMMFGTAERHATGRPVPLLMQYLINRAHNNER